jgi:hypothetical protein
VRHITGQHSTPITLSAAAPIWMTQRAMMPEIH